MITKLAVEGNTDAQDSLGLRYVRGEGVVQDYKQAFYWFKKAAEQGYAYAQYNLGVCHFESRGVEQDYKKAVYW